MNEWSAKVKQAGAAAGGDEVPPPAKEKPKKSVVRGGRPEKKAKKKAKQAATEQAEGPISSLAEDLARVLEEKGKAKQADSAPKAKAKGRKVFVKGLSSETQVSSETPPPPPPPPLPPPSPLRPPGLPAPAACVPQGNAGRGSPDNH